MLAWVSSSRGIRPSTRPGAIHNEVVAPNDFEITRLRAALPEYFDKDGSFMLDRLQDSLRAGEVDLTREGYELKFLGKSYAKYLTSTNTTTVVVPDLVHNAEDANADSKKSSLPRAGNSSSISSTLCRLLLASSSSVRRRPT